MAGKFEVFKDKAGEYRFRLKAGNGQVILASEGYKRRAGVMNGIKSVKNNVSSDANFACGETKSGEHRFNLLARNKQVIGTSESYKTLASRDKGIQSVRKNAPDAPIQDQTN